PRVHSLIYARRRNAAVQIMLFFCTVLPQLLRRTQDALSLLVRGHRRRLRRALGRRLHSETLAIGLRRDLDCTFVHPTATIPLVIRPLRSDDDLSILNIDQPGLTSDVVFERLSQRRLISA